MIANLNPKETKVPDRPKRQETVRKNQPVGRNEPCPW